MHGREAPRSVVRAWSSSFAAPESSHKRIIDSHEFNSSVRVVVPSTALAQSVSQALAGSDVYYRCTRDASCVVDRSAGLDGVTLLSDCAGMGDAPVLARTQSGAVAIVLSKDAHEHVGLPGVGQNGRWRTQLTLADVTPRERGKLASLPAQPLLACYPCNSVAPDAAVALDAPALRLNAEVRPLPGLIWPHGYADGAATAAGDDARRALDALLEWIGAVAVGATALTTHELRSNQMAPLFCAYRLECLRDAEGAAASATSHSVEWSGGLVSSASCARVLDVLRASLGPSECAAMIVSGFEHAPFTWGAAAHHASFFASSVCTKYALFVQPGGLRYCGFVVGDGVTLPL